MHKHPRRVIKQRRIYHHVKTINVRYLDFNCSIWVDWLTWKMQITVIVFEFHQKIKLQCVNEKSAKQFLILEYQAFYLKEKPWVLTDQQKYTLLKFNVRMWFMIWSKILFESYKYKHHSELFWYVTWQLFFKEKC